jgi:glycerate 2-kinase
LKPGDILIAPNAFKHALDAGPVADAIAEGLVLAGIKAKIRKFPMADGGDGTARLLNTYLNAEWISKEVQGPLKHKLKAGYSFQEEQSTAYIDLAEASGIRHLKTNELNIWQGNTLGTGELMMDALKRGAKTIYLGLGGSASVEGGLGILLHFGFQFLDEAGSEISCNAAGLRKLHCIIPPKQKPIIELKLLVDVDNSLCGEKGAARVFAAQKGANPRDILELESLLNHYAKLIHQLTNINVCDVKGGGAAGGVAAGLHALLDAEIISGSEFFMERSGIFEALKSASVLITGEGSFDAQSAYGKAPYRLLTACRDLEIPCVVFAGKLGQLPSTEAFPNSEFIEIGGEHADLASALKNTYNDLKSHAFEWAKSSDLLF